MLPLIVDAVYNGERPIALHMSHHHRSCAMGLVLFSGPSNQSSIPLMRDITLGLPKAFIETHSLLKMF